MNLNDIWNDIILFFEKNVWNIILFFSILFIGIILTKVLLKIIKRILNKTKIEKIAIDFVIIIFKIVLISILLLILLSVIGIEITGILTAISAVLLAVGLALQGIISNAANGFVVVSSKMFKKDDYIYVDGQEGTVSQINFLYTTLITYDNKKITIPNSTIVNSSVINYDSFKTRRMDIKFLVSYKNDIEIVKNIILNSIGKNKKVLRKPSPFCSLINVGKSNMEFILKFWCNNKDYWDLYYSVSEEIYINLKLNHILLESNQIELIKTN